MIRRDYSSGIVPLKCEEGVWRVFLVRHQSGHWTLPKGHPEAGEGPIECAKRELAEETGLVVEKLLFDKPLEEQYQFQSGKFRIDKTVEYFIALVSGQVCLQQEEIHDGGWYTFSEASDRVTYPKMKALLVQVHEMLASI